LVAPGGFTERYGKPPASCSRPTALQVEPAAGVDAIALEADGAPGEPAAGVMIEADVAPRYVYLAPQHSRYEAPELHQLRGGALALEADVALGGAGRRRRARGRRRSRGSWPASPRS
jgi:hypothetical protein